MTRAMLVALVCAVGAISLHAQQRAIQPTKFTRAPMI